ncbi:Hypothetical protein NCS54_01490700 [Fusarium falciforme]|uniref:Hypothetical protein n=1 Tax=Fusarium falciforme TaxID=195108 RepID=UPI0022FFDEE3|nr:Hypothetical protein NCS54_01490700 [Fusarium falciforme]WAO97193.1 Hypothetical protein NCS54_01490700 [Fusarium falciforme]
MQPTEDVLEAFCISTPPVPINGGRGLCLRAGDTILKSSDDDEESEWVGTFCESITAPESSEYRTPRPIRSEHGFVYKGWTAWTFLPGKWEPNFEAILKACHSFHADVAKLGLEKPDFLATRRNRWTEADLVTWEEKTLNEVADVNAEILSIIQPILDQLLQLRKPLPSDLKNELIHGDMTGNVLFDDNPDIPLGIIDITFYWRPAAYAEAIVVADGLAWHGRGRELVEMLGTDEVRIQLLVRALYWRFLTFAIDPDLGWVRANFPKTDYGRCVEIVQGFIR